MQYAYTPAHELAGLLQRNEVSSEELVRAALARIAALDGTLHAFNCVLEDEALAVARAVAAARAGGEALPPFAGVPIAIKDNFCMTGTRTTCSSKMLERFVSPYDATVVEKCRAAMLPIVGKTNMDEFAMGSSTENSAFGASRNPWDTERIPGGSSGGSAVAVAAGVVPWALGSDTGGSIRQPAALCGVSGMKPTYGRVSRYGLVAFASSLDQIGPFARDARDSAALLGIIAGHDPRDSTSIPQPVPNYESAFSEDMTGMRIGIPSEYFTEGTHPEVEARVKQAIATLEGLGATAVEISLPHTKCATPTYYVICMAEASSNLARYDGVVYSSRTKEPVGDIVEMFRKTRSEAFGAEVKRRIMLGTYVLSAGYYDAYYLKASRIRTLLRQDFENALKTVDVIVCPTSPTPAFRRGEKTSDPLEMYLCDIFTTSLNLAGLPGMSIPCGFTGEGLPVGLQIIAGVLEEGKILRVAGAYQRATDWHTRQPL